MCHLQGGEEAGALRPAGHHVVGGRASVLGHGGSGWMGCYAGSCRTQKGKSPSGEAVGQFSHRHLQEWQSPSIPNICLDTVTVTSHIPKSARAQWPVSFTGCWFCRCRSCAQRGLGLPTPHSVSHHAPRAPSSPGAWDPRLPPALFPGRTACSSLCLGASFTAPRSCLPRPKEKMSSGMKTWW
jgi:hypothetical protein